MYHQFTAENGEKFGSFEVYHTKDLDHAVSESERGWYWWACFPGCLPDGEPYGPFETYEEAIKDAQDS